MRVVKFKELSEDDLDLVIETHFNYWSKINPKMEKEKTIYKFKNLYTKDTLPYGFVLKNDDQIVGFCALKLENLKKYPKWFPWISDVFIFEEFRGKGYGKSLVESAQNLLKEEGYKKVYVWTDQAPGFYKKLGFNFLQIVEKNEGGFAELFSKEL